MSSVPITSQTWLQNFRPYVNGVRVRWSEFLLMLAAGESVVLMLEFEYSYLIGDRESPIRICCEPGEEEVGLVSDPPFGQLVEMAEGLISLSWTISATQTANGPFEIHFEMPLYQGMPNSPSTPGAVLNFAQDLEVMFDAFPVAFSPNHHGYPCHGTTHTVWVRPTLTSQLLNMKVKLLTDAEKVGVGVTPWPQTPQVMTAEGVKWQFDCRHTTKDEGFSLQLVVQDMGVTSLPLRMSLAHNLVTAYRWSEENYSHPDITWYSHHIRATSVFLGSPARGVQVTVKSGDGSSFETTDSKGEAQKNDYTSVGVEMLILNRYDGTVV